MATPATPASGVLEEPPTQLRRQAAIASLTTEALGGMRVDALMERAVQSAACSLDALAAAVCELDASRGVIELRKWHGPGAGGTLTCSALPFTLFGHCLVHGRPVLVDDWREEARFACPPALRQIGVRSTVAAPVSAGEGLQGVLSAHSPVPGQFSVDDVDALREIAGVLAAGLRRGRLEELLQARAAQHAALAELAQLTLSDSPLEQVLARGTELVAATMGADLVTVSARSPDGAFRVRAAHPHALAADARGPARRSAAMVADRGDTGGAASPLEAHTVHCSIAAGIGSEGAHGVLAVHSRDPNRYGSDDMRLVEACANMLAGAVERSNAERRAAAHRAVSAVLATAETPEAAAPALVRAVCDELGWDMGALWMAGEEGEAELAAAWAAPGLDVAAGGCWRWSQLPDGHPASDTWRCGLPRWTHSAQLLGDLGHRADIAGLGLQAGVWAPVGHAGRVVGVLELLSRQPQPVDRHLLPALATIASQVGLLASGGLSQRALAESEERRRRAVASMLRADEEERVRIAGELHDDTVQEMAAILITLDRVVSAAERGDPHTVTQAASQARSTLATATERARRLLFELRPPLLDARGLGAALRGVAERAGRDAGFAVAVHAEVGRHPHAVETLVYRTMSELIANARAHSGAGRLQVALLEDGDHLVGRVEDDGCGFDVDRVLAIGQVRGYSPLAALLERIILAGGELDVHSRPGAGTVAVLRVPAG
jgi:signal transduction histidine kinase